MRKEEKRQIIDSLAAQLEQTPNFYLTDISGLNAEITAKLRRECFDKQIKLVVVKNTLLRKALETKELADAQLLFPILEGPSAVMFCEVANAPAKLIKSFGTQYGKPVLKGALVQECAYVGVNQLEALVNIKSREELIADIIALLQSPAKNVISALQSNAGGKIAGIVERLSEKE
ncbi:MAG: 50S ribosomal protein L10 [Bacteroidales bacterium]|nr:50S ribosomal protein L10 [Bacteroidales bacterium]MDD2426311.1 50S ribosomal protein L10 [Bacteroidales bacterium]MDD3989015.1 50S ribosomal protein L10 [Bacteroidales bacterium]MDD4639202.1 50S ribosomal protein L10 [Bacteroidales bacterium]